MNEIQVIFNTGRHEEYSWYLRSTWNGPEHELGATRGVDYWPGEGSTSLDICLDEWSRWRRMRYDTHWLVECWNALTGEVITVGAF